MNEEIKNELKFLFPTPILFKSETELAKQMLPLAKKYLSKDDFLVEQIEYYRKSTFNPDCGLEKLKEFINFKEIVCSIGNVFLDSIGYKLPERGVDFNANIFATEMLRGDRHDTHTHPNCILSGILYLQVPLGSADLVFHDPRPFRKVKCFPPNNRSNLGSPTIQITPKTGMLVMWESWLEHQVLINRSDEGRIALVFNLS